MEFLNVTSSKVQPPKGGSFKIVDGLPVFVEGGAPSRSFLIIGQILTSNRGVGPEGNLRGVVALAKTKGADAVVFKEGFARPTGIVTNGSAYGGSFSASTQQSFITDARWYAVKYAQ